MMSELVTLGAAAAVMGTVVDGVDLTQVQWYLLLGTAVAVIGTVRMLLTRDLVARLIALNVTGIGSLMIILALAARTAESAQGSGDAAGAGAGIDPVLSALVITGLVITVAFTGLGAVLIRRIEGTQDIEGTEDAAGSKDAAGTQDAARSKDPADSPDLERFDETEAEE